VPAAKVQVEAVGDSQPIYYESMPRGEEGNRRAEIYLQG
jgi:flagellar motor protein MotB